jgi:hypothetical protein
MTEIAMISLKMLVLSLHSFPSLTHIQTDRQTDRHTHTHTHTHTEAHNRSFFPLFTHNTLIK